MQIREFAQPSIQPGHARAQDGARPSGDSALTFKHAGSALQNASEELTQSLSGRVMERALKERRITPGSSLAFIPKQKVHSLLHQIRDAKKSSESDDESESDMTSLARDIAGNPHAANSFSQGGGGGGGSDDPTEQFLRLLEAADLIAQGKAGPDPGGRGEAAACEAAEELMALHGESIRADLNTFELAAQGGSAAQAAAFRTAYKDSVIGADSLTAALGHILKLVDGGSGEDFSQAVEKLRTALGLDIAAERPSGDPVRLKNLVSDLFQLKVIATVVDQSQRLGATLASRHGVAPVVATQLTGDLVQISGERWVDASRFSRLADRHQVSLPAACRVDFLTGVRNCVKTLPEQVFSAPEARQSLLDAAQGAIDDAIDFEETQG
jgi:type III secretion protein W